VQRTAPAAAAAAPYIVIDQSQDVLMGTADGTAAAAAAAVGGGAAAASRCRKRRAPDGPSLLQVVLIDSQDEGVGSLQGPSEVSQQNTNDAGAMGKAAGPAPAKRRRQQHQQQTEPAAAAMDRGPGARAACIEILDTQVEMYDLRADLQDPNAAAAARDTGPQRQQQQQQQQRQLSSGFELKLVVDEQERIQNPDPNRIYSSLRQEHLEALHAGVLPIAVTVGLICCCITHACRCNRRFGRAYMPALHCSPCWQDMPALHCSFRLVSYYASHLSDAVLCCAVLCCAVLCCTG
jgi:hypothetical protein